MQQIQVAILVGSPRQRGTSRSIVGALVKLAPKDLKFSIAEIADLPLYNPDQDVEPAPPQWARFRAEICTAEAILFVTPEYNRSIPAPLKNAIDIGSRPYGRSAWAKKPAGIVSLSPGAIGGFGANHHLRQSLVFLDMPVMQQPEAYLGGAHEMLDEAGEVRSAQTRQFLENWLSAFLQHVHQHVLMRQ